MVERQPKLRRYAKDGMKPGLENPLGARALYLFNEKGEDTLFRLHGTAGMGVNRHRRLIRLHPSDEPGHHGSL